MILQERVITLVCGVLWCVVLCVVIILCCVVCVCVIFILSSMYGGMLRLCVCAMFMWLCGVGFFHSKKLKNSLAAL